MLTVTAGALIPVGETAFASSARTLAAIGDDAYFLTIDPVFSSDQTLWVHDGATGTDTQLLETSAQPISQLTPVGSSLYFIADNGSTRDLYVTDGTVGGTSLVKSFTAVVTPNLIAGSNFVYVGGVNSFPGVWRSDGTTAGTVRVNTATDATNLATVGDSAYFLSSGLWRSDGTSATTTKLKTLFSVSGGSPKKSLAVANGSVFFVGAESGVSVGLYVSNGTAAGTGIVKSTPLTAAAELTALGNQLLFTGTDATNGAELWRSDGTPGGTAVVQDIRSGTGSSTPTSLTASGSSVFFTATVSAQGRELWKTDGTSGGTSLVKEITPGAASSTITNMTDVSGTLIFTAVDAESGSEPWRSDGTEAGTVRAADVYPGVGGSGPKEFVAYDGGVIFEAVDPGKGFSVFTLDLTGGTPPPAPMLLRDVIDGGMLNPSVHPKAMPDGRLYFSAGDNTSFGNELYATTGGTIADVTLVADINPGTASSSPGTLYSLGSTLFFGATGLNIGTELYKSDGTSAGTVLVKDLYPGTQSGSPVNMVEIGSTLYFSGWENSQNFRIWQTNGTTAGTSVYYATGSNLLVNFNGVLKHPGNINAGSISPTSMTVAGGSIYMAAGPLFASFDSEPYVSNGIAAPVQLADIYPGSNAGSSPQSFTYFNGKVYFSANDGSNGRELWRTDGTPAGTSLFADILHPPYEPSGISAAGSRPAGLVNVNGELIFRADDGGFGPQHGFELWATDGTISGTHLLKDITPGVGGSVQSSGVVVNGRYYFLADDGVHGTELWSSDGTEAGTQMVVDLTPGAASSSIQNLMQYNGAVVFTYNDGVSGVRWYSVDAPATTVSAPTVKPDLVASSDLGSSSTDNVTSRDNSSPSKNLQFTVDGTVPTATVRLYADGILIGSAVATGSTTTVTTDGTVDLADGVHSIQARQVTPGMQESFDSEELLITIDTAAPTVDIVDVSPDPRTNAVSSMTINFSRAVSGVDRLDFSLTRDGGPNLLTSSQTVTTSQVTQTNIRWTLAGLSSITAVAGTYTLTLTAAGSNIADLTAGNALTTDASDTWVLSMPAWVGAGSQASWNSSTKTLTVTGPTTIVGDPATDSATINADGAGATVSFGPAGTNRVKLAALNLTNGAAATVVSLGAARTASNHRVLVTNSVNVDASSTLDLADNDLIVDYSTGNPTSAAEAMVAAGFNYGDWLGKRITSSVAGAPASNGNYALGVANNALLVNPFGNGTTTGPLFDGQSVDNTTVLVKFTQRVDLDLDGLVTGNDAAIFNGAFSDGDGGATWMSGDVDLDGLYSSNDAAIFNSFYDESLGAL